MKNREFLKVSFMIMIAHAGGGINGMNYTNSLEAMDANYAKGFRYFELDFSWTSDNELVCLHDWKKRFKKVFGYKLKKPLTFQQFQKILIKTKSVHPCTPETLAQWLIKHPDARIITDVKHNNLQAITKLRDYYPSMMPQFIIQFYQPYEYQALKNLGFKDLIWILYQYDGSKKSVITEAQKMNLVAISMRASQAKKKTYQQLLKLGKKIFVYTINKQDKVNKLHNIYGVTGFYTDFLNP